MNRNERRDMPINNRYRSRGLSRRHPGDCGIRLAAIMMPDTIRSSWLRRRYAMKPTPANPRIIIAHVEGLGTAVSPRPEIVTAHGD